MAAEAVLRAVWQGSERWLVSNHVVAFVGGNFKRSVCGMCDQFSPCRPTIFRPSIGPAAS